MPTEENDSLIQTRIPAAYEARLKKEAGLTGNSAASFLRKMVIDRFPDVRLNASGVWVPKEYVFKEVTLVGPGAEKSAATVSEEFIVPGTGIPGHPEFAQRRPLGVAKPFRLLRLVFSDECAPWVSLRACYYGTYRAIVISEPVPCSLMAKSAEPLWLTPHLCTPVGLDITITVTSNEKVKPKKKIKIEAWAVGEEAEK